MRFRLNLDRIEEVLNRRRTDGWSSSYIFPPRQQPIREKVDFVAVLRHVFLSLLFIIACFFTFYLVLPFIVLIALMFYYNTDRVHHKLWHFFPVLYRMSVQHMLSEGTPLEYALLILGLVGLNLLFLFVQRWAWNRRADRLKREPSPPLPTLNVLLGVWPPPPNASASSPTEPRV